MSTTTTTTTTTTTITKTVGNSTSTTTTTTTTTKTATSNASDESGDACIRAQEDGKNSKDEMVGWDKDDADWREAGWRGNGTRGWVGDEDPRRRYISAGESFREWD